MKPRDNLNKALILYNYDIGGAERRYARFFIKASQNDKQLVLIINQQLYELELRAGIRLDHCQNIEILPSRFKCFYSPDSEYVESQEKSNKKSSNFLLSLAHKLDLAISIIDVWHLIKRKNIEAVHLVLGGVYLGLLPLLFKKHLKTLISIFSVRLEYLSRKRLAGINIGYYLHLIALRKCDAIDAVSPTVRNTLINQGINGDKIEVAPSTFTDYDAFKPGPKKKNWVVFAGRLIHLKNPLLFVKAIPKITSFDSSVRFFILGKGPLEPEITAMIKKLGIESIVSLKYELNISKILSISKIFVSLQQDENYSSQSLLEAMACENAIVATDVGETLRWVDDTTGIRIKPNALQLANAIIYLLNNPILIRKMGSTARKKAMSEHDMDDFVNYLKATYRAL